MSGGNRSIAALVISLALLLPGCMDIHVRAGSRPNPDVLENTLQIGRSTRSDIVAALGVPFGKGREMLPFVQQPRTLWSYYYEEGDLKESRRMFLFVFLKEDLYDGYMWFSSLPK
jgi:hypothetical protein